MTAMEKIVKKYTESHEWITVEGEIATVGVTTHAQDELGDIVYVELPAVDKEVSAGNEAVVLESTKAAADVYAPIGGKIVTVNEKLTAAPETVNADPEGDGWLFKMEVADVSQVDALMDEAAYKAMVGK
ncbi:Glycine cleavage system H protein [Chlamydiales bacterium SCGC AG-110-P3]|nr:Glycine cleavage system H protein [Chlamydiales bacterium SCGC AG-110-P3]